MPTTSSSSAQKKMLGIEDSLSVNKFLIYIMAHTITKNQEYSSTVSVSKLRYDYDYARA